MALYLGENKISANSKITVEGTSSGDDITLTPTQWNNLKNAVEYRTGKEPVTNATIANLTSQLNESYNTEVDTSVQIGYGISTWTRPQGWPDLDSLNLQFTGNSDFIYMTYRIGHDDDFLAFYINLTSNAGTATVDFGHISNGTYVIDSTRDVTHQSYNYYYFDQENEGYIVIRVTGNIKNFYLIGADSTNGTPDNRTFTGYQQHMLERIAYVPNITNFYNSTGSIKNWGTYDLEREKIGNGSGNACTNMANMYYYCYNLSNLDISNFYTNKVTGLASTFGGCFKLKNLDVSHFTNTNNFTNLSGTFSSCQSLTSLDLSNWEISSKLTNLSQTFQNCFSLTTITGLDQFDTSKVTTLSSTFNGCRNLINLEDIQEWDTSLVTSMAATFNNCSKLKKLNLKNWDISNVTNIYSMFQNCYSLKEILFPTGLTKNITSIYYLFYGCYALQKIDVSWIKMDSGTCTTASGIFANCRSVTELNIPNNWDLSGINNSSYGYGSIFQNCYSLQTITGIKDWDFGNNSYTAQYMFQNCYSLKNLDISGWQLKATNYGSMFESCHSLESINISGLNTTNCTTFANMFQNCYSLKSITFPSTWDTAKITTTADMFNSCYNLSSIDINFSNWNVTKITSMASMFSNCYNLRTISMNNLTLSACIKITDMFRYCYNLKEISWTGWSLPKLTSAPTSILASCYSLKKITGLPPIKLNFSLSGSASLPKEEIVTLLNNLQDTGGTSRTLILGAAYIDRLTSTEIAIATAKGWTLA